MLTIEECRIYLPNSKFLSDEKVLEIRNFFYDISETIVKIEKNEVSDD
jgi:hypothetical protein